MRTEAPIGAKIPAVFDPGAIDRLLRRLAAPLLAAALLGLHPDAVSAPKSELWERWTAHDPASSETVDHGAWDTFLSRNLRAADDGVNRIGYGIVSERDARLLDDYLAALSAVPVSGLSRDEQKAYWINLYNALTVKVVLDHYPVESIRDISISPGFFTVGPWGKKLVTVEGESLSLDDVEHRILRPIWQDPRIHYAVNCASLGCPKLMPDAFTADNTETMLEAGARAFINSPHGARFDGGGRLLASSIYDWFQEDFGGDEVGVIAHLSRYAAPALATRLEGVTDIDDFDYDWTLNDAAPARGQTRHRRGSGQR